MHTPQSKLKIERQTREAVALAVQGLWEEAIRANKAILEVCPDDIETHNRLGRAYMEVGDHVSARAEYERSLQLDPYNNIAKKNLNRLSEIEAIGPKEDRHKILADVFVEETSKSRIMNLVNLAPREVTAHLSPGEPVLLETSGQKLVANNQAGQYLGEVDPKFGLRLAKLIVGGNRYSGAISSLGNGELKVLIREVYQDPSQAGRLSFAPQKKERFRPYVKESLIRQRLEEEEAGEEEPEETPEMEGFSDIEL